MKGRLYRSFVLVIPLVTITVELTADFVAIPDTRKGRLFTFAIGSFRESR